MKRIKTLSTFIAIIGLLFIAQEGNAQSIKSDTIRESRLSNLLEAIGNNEGFTVADPDGNNSNDTVGYGLNKDSGI